MTSTTAILSRAVTGHAPTDAEALSLFEDADLSALCAAADEVRRQRVGDTVTFVVTRNINFTNICNVGCRFCSFARREGDPEAELLTMDEVGRRAAEAAARGATEVCLQGGLHPRIDGRHYQDVLRAIRDAAPELHIHAFSPFEIKYGAGKLGWPVQRLLQELKDHGLNTMPGTAAEILDTEVRRQLTRNKLSADEWVHIVRTAHELGIRTTATMMYGHVDAPRHWVAHIALLRDLQRETGGFTEFVPLGFIHYNTALYRSGDARPGPTTAEHLRVHAVARLMLQGQIDNLQVSWVKTGPVLAGRILQAGANDLGGTLMDESISRMAGGQHGQELTPDQMRAIAQSVDRPCAQRTTLYGRVPDDWVTSDSLAAQNA